MENGKATLENNLTISYKTKHATTIQFNNYTEVECKVSKEMEIYVHTKTCIWGFPGGAVVENLPANTGDTGSSPGLGRSHMPRSN